MSNRVEVISANYDPSGYIVAAWRMPDTEISIAGLMLTVSGVGVSTSNFDVRDSQSRFCGFPYQYETSVTHNIYVTPYRPDGTLVDSLGSGPFAITVAPSTSVGESERE